MAGLEEICERRGLRLVEDAAQGLGASDRGRALGSLGDAGCFSFHDTKNVSCGEGGAALWDEETGTWSARRLSARRGPTAARFLRGEVDRYTWVAEGVELRPHRGPGRDSPRAAGQAGRDRGAPGARVADSYRQGLGAWAGATGVRLPSTPPGRGSNYHIFHLLFPDAGAQRRCLAALKARGIGADFYYVPLHSSPFGRSLGLDSGGFAVTERVAATLVRLPISTRC